MSPSFVFFREGFVTEGIWRQWVSDRMDYGKEIPYELEKQEKETHGNHQEDVGHGHINRLNVDYLSLELL